jgi:hypothetical protein
MDRQAGFQHTACSRCEATLQRLQLSSLPVIDFERAAYSSDETLGSIGGSHPSRFGRLLNRTEACIANVAVISCRPGAQHDRTSGRDERCRLSTCHIGSCRSFLGQGVCCKTRHDEEYKNCFQAVAPRSVTDPGNKQGLGRFHDDRLFIMRCWRGRGPALSRSVSDAAAMESNDARRSAEIVLLDVLNIETRPVAELLQRAGQIAADRERSPDWIESMLPARHPRLR